MRNFKMSYYNIYYYCNIADNLLTYFNGYIDWAPTGAQFTEPFFSRNQQTFQSTQRFMLFVNLLLDVLFTKIPSKNLGKYKQNMTILKVLQTNGSD